MDVEFYRRGVAAIHYASTRQTPRGQCHLIRKKEDPEDI